MIVVDESRGDIEALTFYSGRLSHLFELTVLFVMQQHDPICSGYRQIGRPIIVVISGGTTDSVEGGIKSGLARYILEAAIASIVIKRYSTLFAIV